MLRYLTLAERERMLEHGKRSAAGQQIDPHPVVKFFTLDANATWLRTELDPEDPDIAFGLCDLGLGYPELGSVRLSELDAVRGKFNLPVERDQNFRATKPLSAYTDEARVAGKITT